ncbi:MAG: DUF6318 family protein [Aeromicrobium sp.]
MRVIALFIATTLLFSGCGKDEPKEPKHSAEPTITAPTMPSAAQDNTVDGAVAFVKHYVEVFNYASNTGDVKELQRLSDPKCEGCNKYIELYKGTYEAGGYYRNSNWRLANFQVRTAVMRPDFDIDSDDPPLHTHCLKK